MILTSPLFLLAFLPAAYLLYWRVCRTPRQRLALLLALNLSFYVWATSVFVFLLLGMALLTFGFSRRRWTWAGILLNLVPLAFFKALTTGNIMGGLLSTGAGLALPLGISYFTFKHISYLIDVRKGRVPPTAGLLDFLVYSSFFPQIVAGPISRFPETGPQLPGPEKRLPGHSLFLALASVIFGLGKIVLISGPLGKFVAAELPRVRLWGLAWSWWMLALFTLDLYFNFTGYTDLAKGIGLLFGVTLPANFSNPFQAASPRDFWNRWHMSLSNWFRYYVYFPLTRTMLSRFGRERSGLVEYTGIFVTMTLIGIWHGFSVGFLLWGVFNAVLLALQSWGERRGIEVGPAWVGYLFTLAAILFGFSLLAYPNFASTLDFMYALLGGNGWGSFSIDPNTLAVAAVAVLLVAGGMTESENIGWSPRPRLALALGLLAALCLFFLGSDLRNFAYARF